MSKVDLIECPACGSQLSKRGLPAHQRGKLCLVQSRVTAQARAGRVPLAVSLPEKRASVERLLGLAGINYEVNLGFYSPGNRDSNYEPIVQNRIFVEPWVRDVYELLVLHMLPDERVALFQRMRLDPELRRGLIVMARLFDPKNELSVLQYSMQLREDILLACRGVDNE